MGETLLPSWKHRTRSAPKLQKLQMPPSPQAV
jgi:hypothetical protein